ncbi:MAG: hypothetical protein JNN30_22360 [Rhodanobacteraceae bacterium]|nr:hypothetical protein [Rhodanobacteraceae bacterium]
MNKKGRFGEIDWVAEIQEQLSMAGQARRLLETADVRSQLFREYADTAFSAATRMQQAHQLAASQIGNITASISEQHSFDLIKRIRRPDLSYFRELSQAHTANLLERPDYFDQLLPSAWKNLLSGKAISSQFLGANAARSAAEELTESLRARFTLPDSGQFAEQVTHQLNAQLRGIFPRNYFDQIQQVVDSIDLDSIYSVARAAAERMAEEVEAADPKSIDEVSQVVERADLNELSEIVQKAVAAAFRDAVEKGVIGGDRSFQIRLFVLNTLFSLLFTVSQVVGQPIFGHWYEAKKAQEAATGKDAKAAKPQQRAAEDKPLLVSVKLIRLRLGPDTKQRIVATVQPGQILIKRRVKRDWTLVQFVDPLGDGVSVAGWVRSKEVRPVEVETQRMIFCALDALSDETDDCLDEDDADNS